MPGPPAAPPPTHPADAPEYAGRRALYRTACLGMALVLCVVAVGFGMVVTFALGNVPLAGNRFTVFGLPALAAAAVAATPAVVLAAFGYGRWQQDSAVRRMLQDHPEVTGPEADADRLLNAVGARLFATHAVLFGGGLAAAILYHLTSSPGLLGCAAAFAVALAAFHPTGRLVRAWYDRGAAEFLRLRG